VIRAVIDTNVLVSGLLSPAGNGALIVLACRPGVCAPVPVGGYHQVLMPFCAINVTDRDTVFVIPPQGD
jgi:hypothetical protein